MRPKKHETTGSGDLFRARLDRIINMRHELVQLAAKIDWEYTARGWVAFFWQQLRWELTNAGPLLRNQLVLSDKC